MTASKLVGLLFEAWDDLNRVMAGLTPEVAVQRIDGGSSFAWTAGHVTNQLDGWINVRLAGGTPHPLLGDARFRIGGDGAGDDWPAIQAAIQDVRAAAAAFLRDRGEDDLDMVVAYDGSFARLREVGLSLRHALLRVSAHHYFHIGEIATKRDRLGHRVGDYPGALERTI